MVTASELRARAREALKNNWGTAILAVFIAGLIMGAGDGIGLAVHESVSSIISLVLSGPLMLGLAYFFIGLVRKYPVKLETVFEGFKDFVGSFVLGILISIFVVLWALLLIIPGIVKAYEYSMSYFIKVDNPNLDASEAITRSKVMMNGNKWRLFCLDLSFIGWILLCIITFGIAVLWIAPYIETAHAEFYEDLKQKEIASAPMQPATEIKV